jgi:hypothetical protein
MGILYITEYAQLMPSPPGGVGQVPMEPALATQTVSFTTHTESLAFNAQTRVVRVHTDSICSLIFGASPVATTSHPRMAAGQTEYHGVPVGASYKVSAVSNT